MHTSMFEDIVTKEQLDNLDKDLCIQGYVHGTAIHQTTQ